MNPGTVMFCLIGFFVFMLMFNNDHLKKRIDDLEDRFNLKFDNYGIDNDLEIDDE